MQYFRQFKHNLTEQFFIEHVIIASDLQLIQDINELDLGQFEHWIEHFLHINFLHILQKRVQFLHNILCAIKIYLKVKYEWGNESAQDIKKYNFGKLNNKLKKNEHHWFCVHYDSGSLG